ncbi:DNA glycosylase [Wolfiporia cocos MD-104 SS10]|uniref:Endonuclease III homolog n=1 Tax=Wolfiporia cocos (strain MD-104) TaxID=742152 RepID=A0A2H3J8I8_WOLCO|nr:DNA glycosylase [Wolfiporia cocos MD-104 SS10]
MPSLKRSASPVLEARPSPYHPSVTLFAATASAAHDAQSSPRRSRRLVDNHVRRATASATDIEEETASPRKTSGRATSGSPTKRTRSASPRKPKPVPQALETPHPAPPRWREAYDAIKEMRSQIVAPVDTMGAGAAQLGETVPENKRFATLISLMLSSQTKDEVTSAAVVKLREAVGGSLSVDAILRADDSVISNAICKVGFWRRKTEYIKQTAQRLHDEFNSDVPKTVDELCSLPGVGPKMAFLTLHVAWKINAGIGVDVHVHRITNRLKWHQAPTKTPEETRLNLQSWLPTELRPTFTRLLVGFGQTICLPTNPRCDQCSLSSGLCPSVLKTPRRSGKLAGSDTQRKGAKGSHTGPKLEISIDEDKLLPPARKIEREAIMELTLKQEDV